MAKKQDGWWQIFRAPVMDGDGKWSITEENTKTGEKTLHHYDSEEAAQAAYQGMFQSMLTKKWH